ncbi:PfkB family carbohydrate kinase [Nocardioides sp. B-3]|uniref:PfkB family carbohydrate kinase n=1 Tax=Nocardioides sp. B-3 TaxID=2895565 RepID=UPI002152F508|nr:PfkB family carbohydrate kinase [Nocardioides sp. B-3]UUZ57876.1 PfkB family carbohydrate kinase [Nocardioides sp. B-3]
MFDLNARPAITGTGAEVVARAEAMGALADVVKASDEDLDELWPTRDHADVAADFPGRGAGAFILTRGEDGLRWFTPKDEGEVPAVTAVVADTIGAGDTVTAAIVDALWGPGVVGPASREGLRSLHAQDWTAVLEHAGRAAAITVSRPGGDPPWRHELA